MMALFDKIHPDIFELLRKYSSLIPPKHLRFPSNLRAVTVHDFLVNHAILHLEKQLEAEPELENNYSIYEHYLALLASDSSSLHVPIVHLTGQKYHNEPSDQVDIRSYQTTTLLESRTVVESGTTGLRTWPASLILAQYLILNPGLVHRQKMLELGSGVDTELPPGTVWMSDLNDSVLSRCRDNVQLP
ncbi:hypothetical protein C8J57DRAFT_1267094 [Mycena rebaudengoi]|nr:hypothetical protein C8J57DRAFT_1267094 [Mycena rebaudengoi]